MKYTIKSKIEDINSQGEIYIKISTKKYNHFWIMLPLWDPIKKGQDVEIRIWSCIPPEKSNDKTKWVKIEKNQNHLVNYNGPIIEKLEKYFLVDATLPILVDKEQGFKVGDYITGGFNHTIQAKLIKNNENEN